jgi:hypothetical protein
VAPGPGRELFDAVREDVGDLPVIAEDLGVITPAVEKLRDELGLPGMHVMQWSFVDDAKSPHRIENHRENGVVYTGTHDNDTALGWWRALEPEEQAATGLDARDPAWSLIERAVSSRAVLAVVPMQDVLGARERRTDERARSESGNWGWRLEPGALTPGARGAPPRGGGSGRPRVILETFAAALICLDPGTARAVGRRQREPIGPGSRTLKIKDPGGAAGEAAVALAIARRTRALLLDARLPRRDDAERPGYTGGNIARAKFCNARGAALMLRIHADGSTSTSQRGAHTLYPRSHRGWTDDVYRPSLLAATLVQRELIRATGARDLGLQRRSDLTGFNWADVPVVLTEVGFLSNPTESRPAAHGAIPAARRARAHRRCRRVSSEKSKSRLG